MGITCRKETGGLFPEQSGFYPGLRHEALVPSQKRRAVIDASNAESPPLQVINYLSRFDALGLSGLHRRRRQGMGRTGLGGGEVFQ